MLGAAQDGRPIDMDNYRADLREQLAEAIMQDQLSPIPLGKDRIMRAYSSLIGPSMAGQIVKQYMNAAERNIQRQISQGDDSHLMRPMISSVIQLDR